MNTQNKCPFCKSELVSLVLTSNPPQYRTYCPKCKKYEESNFGQQGTLQDTVQDTQNDKCLHDFWYGVGNKPANNSGKYIDLECRLCGLIERIRPGKPSKPITNNSTQNDHETHTACIERIRKEGASSTCCYCDPHEGCTLGMKPTQNDWEKKVSEWFSSAVDFSGNEYGYQSRHDGLIELVAEIRADARKEVIESVISFIDELTTPDHPQVHSIRGLRLSSSELRKFVDRLATLKEEKI